MMMIVQIVSQNKKLRCAGVCLLKTPLLESSPSLRNEYTDKAQDT